MFIGHFGVGFAAKKIENSPSLGTLFLASQFIDLLWPIFILTGIEQVKIEVGNTAFTPLNFISYPYSHSFFGVLIWSILFSIVYFLLKKNKKNAIFVGSLVMSHWVLDLITHRTDLQLFPWSDIRLGLGLWNSVAFTLLVEVLIYVIGACLYIMNRKDENKKKQFGVWSLFIILLAIYLINTFGSVPPSEEVIGVAGLSLWLFVAWAYWIDRKDVIKI